MSYLPQYSETADDDHPENESLVKSGHPEVQSGAYPPHQAESSSSGTSGPRHHVTYIFDPSWPIQGTRQEVMGVLGRDVRVCTSTLTTKGLD